MPDNQRVKVYKTEPVIPLHTCLPCMAGVSQGAFIVMQEISRSDISCIDKKILTSCKIDMQGLTEYDGRCKMKMYKM